ncbi:MAG: Zn-dependent exopeptidase M28 [Saprospiraceae bacterium]|nr:Zn-dependent exopeptidase M28 [Saprospiraceae bacterium]
MLRTLLIFLLLVFLMGIWYPIFGQQAHGSPFTQQDVIAYLSGEKTASKRRKLNARTTTAERRIARLYLQEWMEELQVDAQEHGYRQPNLHPALDFLLTPYKGTNLYGILPAQQTDAPYVILGAHYDSKLGCPGAVDNASGIALIFGVLQQLVSLEERKKHVMIVFFDQEEEELIGSTAFVQFLKREQYPIHSVHTFDMVGWDGDGNYEVELGAPSPLLLPLYKKHASLFEIPLYSIPGGSTDYQSFLKEGYPVIGVNEAFVKQDFSPYKDTPKDTYDTVNFEYLQQVTRYVTSVITDLITSEDAIYESN